MFVRRKRKRAHLSKDEHIPKVLDGLATDIVAVGRPRGHSEIDTDDRFVALYDDTERKSAISALVSHPDGGMVALGSGHGLLPIGGGGFVTGRWGADERPIGFVEDPQAAAGSLWFGNIGGDLDYGVVRFPDLDPPAALDGHTLAGAPIGLAPAVLQPHDFVQHIASRRGFRITGRIVATSLRDLPITMRSDEGIDTPYTDVIAVVGDRFTFSMNGESGSLVFDDARRAVGFVVGGGRDPDDPDLDVSFVLRAFPTLRGSLGNLFSLFFTRSNA